MRISNHLSKFVNRDEIILDCGCGSMRISEMLHKQRGVKAFGTDVIPLNQTDHHICLCSGERLGFKDKSFDSVFLIFTLHHMTDPSDALKEGLRVSRKRLVVLEDVYKNSLELSLLKLLDWSGNILISKDMSFPFSFKTEWKTIFESLGIELVAAESIRPIPWRPSRHRMFVLDNNHS